MPIICLPVCISFQVLASLEDEEDINEVRAALGLNVLLNNLRRRNAQVCSVLSYYSGLSMQWKNFETIVWSFYM